MADSRLDTQLNAIEARGPLSAQVFGISGLAAG